MEIVLPKPRERSSSGGKREQTKRQNRQIILKAAREVFTQMGYGAATVRDIIRATPLASGTFYNYFKSKDEVYQTICDEVALAIRPRLRAERSKATSVEEFIGVSVRTFFDFIAHQPEGYHFIRNDGEATRIRLDTPEVIAGFEELREDIESAMRKGLFPPVDADYLMAAIAGATLEVSAHMLTRPNFDPTATAAFVSALLLSGVHTLPQGKAPSPAAELPASDGKTI